MATAVNPATLDKLLHPIQEIRVRSLHDIENTLKRALWDDADIGAVASPLFKNLIRWFGHVPIIKQVTVLELMSLLLESKYGKDILSFFTPMRIVKELMKIRCLIGSNLEYDELVVKIIKQVERLKSTPSASATSSSSIDLLESVASSMASLKLDRIDPLANGSAGDGESMEEEEEATGTEGGRKRKRRTVIDAYAARWKGDPSLYAECWEVPEPSVESVLDRLNESLFEGEPGDENFQRALNYAIPYMRSYPPEFFLQPPYIGLSLLHLIQSGRLGARKGYGMMLALLISFRKRMRQRMLTVTYIKPADGETDGRRPTHGRRRPQISIGAFVYELFQLCIEQLKGLSGDGDRLATNMMLIVLSQTTSFLMTEHFCDQQKIPAHRFGELCGELGRLVRHYRQEWEVDGKRTFARTRYRIALQIMADFVRLWQKEPDAVDGGADETMAGGRTGTIQYKFVDMKVSSTAHRQALERSDGVWREECQLALYDYPLGIACPELYEHLGAHVEKKNELMLVTLTRLREKLVPAVQLLQDGSGSGKNCTERQLLLGWEAISTLGLHRSVEMVRCLLKAVESWASSVTEDEPLWDVIESITVRLLAHGDEEIRSVAYELCANMMKDFIGHLDEGAILSRRSLFSSSAPKLRAMGMPLSLQIITEITCFGYTSKNSKIHQCAETMLLFLCNSKAFLREKWADVEEILLQITPLLQTVAVGREESKLRKAVLNMFHPDFGLPWLDILQGNLRLLFHLESAVREEALTRVLFLLSSVEESEKLAPRIEHISDTVPNGVCLLSFPYDIRRQQVANVYEVSAVKPLLDALEQEEGDPTLRRSALTQLNVMADDPALCELIHNASGWVLVMKALYNSLLADPVLDYPDAALPAVGILTKLCFSNTTFRRFLGSNTNAYQLIVRALLAHHHMPVFRVECCALLYLLLFADCSTGNGALLSLPAVCAASAFKLPFVSCFHWQASPFREYGSEMEQLLERMLLQDGPGGDMMLLGAALANGCAEEGSSACSVRPSVVGVEYAKRYLRFTFADLWFGGLENILKTTATTVKRAGAANGVAVAEDDQHPLVYRGANKKAMEFSAALRLTRQDIRWLKMIDFPAIFRKSMRRLASAKAHTDVYGGLATLEANLSFPLKNTICQQDVIISTLKRYIHTPPVSVADQEMLVEVFNVIGIMLHLNFRMLRDWLFTVLAAEDNFFLRLLRSSDCIEPLFTRNANLIWGLLQLYDGTKDPATATENAATKKEKQQQQAGGTNDWDVRVFRAVLEQLDVCLKKCNLSRIMSLLELVEMMTGLLDDVWRVDVGEVIPKLLQCVRQVGSTSYTGSVIVRSCLMATAHLLERTSPEQLRFEWQAKHLKTVSTQCGNSCTFVRSFAWNILTKVARTPAGAAAIVQECAYLPGGIHASCLSTILDDGEACLVRESAVGLFVILLSHTEADGSLQPAVLPMDGAASMRRAASTAAGSAGTTPKGGGSFDVILELLAKQQFFEAARHTLAGYTCMEFLLEDVNPSEPGAIISADVVRAFAVLFRALVELDPAGFGKLIGEKGCLQWLLDCVEQQAMLPNRAVCLMVGDVCQLLQRCLDEPNRERVCSLLAGHQNFIESVIYMLNPWLYGKLTQPVMEQTLCYIMRFLCALVVTPTGKQQIHHEFGHQDVKPIAKMIELGISHESKTFQIMCLKFLCMMMHTSDERPSPTAEYPTFLIQFEQMDMYADAGDAAKCWKPSLDRDYSEAEDDTENTNPNRPAANAAAEQDKQPEPKPDAEQQDGTLRSGSAVIFSALMQQFESFCNRDQLVAGGITTSSYKRTVYSTLQTMLHFSIESCRVAWRNDLLTVIFDWFDAIHEGLIGRLTYAEFVRKYGDVKKLSVMAELKELASVLGTWFSVPDEPCQLEPAQIDRLCQTVLQYWPWFGNHGVLQMEFLQVLAFLSECRIAVCKALVATYPGHPHSIMKLLIVAATGETAKVKGPKYDLNLLRVSLRLLKNCCCCQEGRSMIGKLNVFGNISKLHPSVTKLQKPWLEVTQLWLEFYEVYTRYVDVSEVRHLTVLGALIRKSDIDVRLLSLTIVRNLTFVPNNRAALLASADYMFILQNALQRTSCRTEVLMAAVAVWKMIANNQRGKAAIKSSPLVRLIEGQVKHYSMTPEGNDKNELWCVLMTVYHILNA
uniref:Rotatin N-terminal domain-containing protein n=1 Tax=Anopheles gambiae TaxID=7165 RepID=A0A1S4H7L0_ANOGA